MSVTYRGRSTAWMLWLWGLLLLVACCERCHAQTSNVETVKAWTRTYVLGMPGGSLRDPTGSIADAQRLAVSFESINASSNLVSAAASGLSNGLARLYSVIARTNDFTGRVYIAADMDDDPDYRNVWGAVVHEAVDPDGTLHYFCHYSRELANPPRTRWYFDIGPTTAEWADGVAPTNNVTTNMLGYACYDIRVTPPANVGNVVLRANKFMRIGAPEFPLDIDDAGIRMIVGSSTNDAYTGSVAYTNAVGSVTNVITETYLSGTLYLIATNSIGGTP